MAFGMLPPVEFTCHSCLEVLECEDHLSGSILACGNCRVNLRVPAADLAFGGPDLNHTLSAVNSSIKFQDITLGPDGFGSFDASQTHLDQNRIPLTPPPYPEGSTKEHRYDIGDELARGGMGIIHQAEDKKLQRLVAIKVLLADTNGHPQLRSRFEEEAKITARLQHPGIVPIHDLGQTNSGAPYYVMKLLDGQTLQEILTAQGEQEATALQEFPLSRLLTLFIRACEAMQYAHAKDVIHRDLKPENIMVGEFGEVQVLDWGLAKEVGDGKAEQETIPCTATAFPTKKTRKEMGDETKKLFLSFDGQILGTPRYMSPEQASGKLNRTNKQSDIYCLGAILYTILCLEAPIEATTFKELCNGIIQGKIRAPEERNTDRKIPGALSAIAMKALSRRPRDRYQDISELIQDLHAYQNGFVTQAEKASHLTHARKFIRRNALASATALTIVSLVAVSSIINLHEKRKAQQALIGLQEVQQKRKLDQQTSAPAIFASAEKFLLRGDVQAALPLVQTVVDSEPNHHVAWNTMLAIHASQKNLHAFEATWEQAIGERTPSSEQQALHDALLPVAKNPESNQHLLALSTTLSQQGWPSLANHLEYRHWKVLENHLAHLENNWPGSTVRNTLGFNAENELEFSGYLTEQDPPLEHCLTTLSAMPLADLSLRFEESDEPIRLDGIQGLKTLKRLSIAGRPLANIDALQGIQLEEFTIQEAAMTSLMGLSSMPLRRLELKQHASSPGLSNLAGLEYAPLTSLTLEANSLSDLSAIKDAPIQEATFCNTGFTDLSPLANAPITFLRLDNNLRLRSLAGLEACPIKRLETTQPPVELNMSAVTDMPLKKLTCRMPLYTKHLSFLYNSKLSCLELLEPDTYQERRTIRDLFPLLLTQNALQTVEARAILRGEIFKEAVRKGNLAAAKAEAKRVDFIAKKQPWARPFLKEQGPQRILALLEDPRAWTAKIVRFNRHQYSLSTVYSDWETARRIAIAQGGHLVSITTEAEFKFLEETFDRTDYWIGLHYDSKKKGWQWSDSSPIKLSKYDFTDTISGGRAMLQSYCRGPWVSDRKIRQSRFVIEWDFPSDHTAQE